MGSRTAVAVFELAAFDRDGENTWERVGGRAEDATATALRHWETASLPVDSGEEMPAVDGEEEEPRADAGDGGLILRRPAGRPAP